MTNDGNLYLPSSDEKSLGITAAFAVNSPRCCDYPKQNFKVYGNELQIVVYVANIDITFSTSYLRPRNNFRPQKKQTRLLETMFLREIFL